MASELTRTRFFAAALACVALVEAAEARGDEIAEPIAAGIALYDDLEYKAAAETLTAALEDDSLPVASKIAGLEVLGLAQVALGDENAARDTFRRLLELDRRFDLDAKSSPAARALLAELRLDLPSEVTIALRGSPDGGRANSPVTLRFRIEDPSAVVDGVVVHYKSGETRRFSTVQATRVNGEGDYTATILGALVKPPRLAYYITARANSGAIVATLGDSANVQAIDIGAAAGTTPILRRPLVWVGVGAVVVGGAAVAFLLLRDGGEMGFVSIRPIFPR